MTDVGVLILLSLATWRVSTMIVREDGPGNVFFHIRSWVGITHDPDRHILTIPDRFLPNLLSCVWCTSVWVAADWVLLWLLAPQIAEILAAIPALSALAIVLDWLISGQRSP